MSHAKSSLQWSVIHYQVTFECPSGRGSETSIARRFVLLKVHTCIPAGLKKNIEPVEPVGRNNISIRCLHISVRLNA